MHAEPTLADRRGSTQTHGETQTHPGITYAAAPGEPAAFNAPPQGPQGGVFPAINA